MPAEFARGKSNVRGGAPRTRRALSNQYGPVQRGGEPEASQVLAEAWKIAETREADLFTHAFHSWPARMHPGVAHTILRAFAGVPGARVLDPFSGSGTVAIEAMRLGHSAAGVDLNPLAEKVARIKSSLRPREERRVFLAKARRLAATSSERVQLRDPVRADLDKRIFTQFDTHVAKEMAGLLELVNNELDAPDKEAFEVVFSSLVNKFSRRIADTSRDEVQKRLRKGLFSELFLEKCEELADRWTKLVENTPQDATVPKFLTGTLHTVRLGNKADIVLTSPPYGGIYDYADQHDLRLAWLGLSSLAFRQGEMGARRDFSGAESEAVRLSRWDDEMRGFLTALRPFVRARGNVFLVLGDAQFSRVGKPHSALLQLGRLQRDAELGVVAFASQERGKSKYEHIVMLQYGAPLMPIHALDIVRKSSPVRPVEEAPPEKPARRPTSGRGPNRKPVKR